MTESAKLLESCKQEIRSVLQGAQRGLILTAFLKDYKSFIGQNLPFVEFGYQSAEHFLKDMPDVVYMTWYASANTYHLRAVADESTKHIEKLVSKQKVTKNSTPFSVTRKKTNSYFPPRFRPLERPMPLPFIPVADRLKIFQVAKNCVRGCRVNAFMEAFFMKHGSLVNYQSYGYPSIEKCLEDVPGVFLRTDRGSIRVFCNAEYENEIERSAQSSSPPKATVVVETRNEKWFEPQTSLRKPQISESIKNNFEKVLDKCPGGVWDSEFCETYELVTNEQFNPLDFGYANILELVNCHVDIFKKHKPEGSQNNFLLFSASADVPRHSPSHTVQDNSEAVSLFRDTVCNNVHRLLMRYPKGIYVDEFIHMYTLNNQTSLDLDKLGFDKLENFLLSASGDIVLKFDSQRGKNKVCLESEIVEYTVKKQLHDVPCEAVLPGCDYEPQVVPPNFFGTEQYFPIYIGTVVHPGLFWLQIVGNETTEQLKLLMDKLNNFYKSASGDAYRVNENHVMVGFICAGIWIGDGSWHRIKVTGMSPTMDFIDAHFVDYGTFEKVSVGNLRYLKSEFLKLPAQAVKAKLAYLEKPVNCTWDEKVRDTLLNLSINKPLMSKFIRIPTEPNIVNVWLCDCTKEEDLHINLHLVKQGFAIYVKPDSSPKTPNKNAPPTYTESPDIQPPTTPCGIRSPHVPPLLNPSLTQNEQEMKTLSSLVQFLNMGNKNAGLQQNHMSHIDPIALNQFLATHVMNAYGQNPYAQYQTNHFPNTFGPPGISSPYGSSLSNQMPMSNHLTLTIPSYQAPWSPEKATVTSMTEPQRTYIDVSKLSYSAGTRVSSEESADSGEIFNDEDEADFEEAITKNSEKRYVMRMKLKDGYIVHIIAFEDQPYITSGDVTNIFWDNEEDDTLYRKLRGKDLSDVSRCVMESEHQEMFRQLICYDVRGMRTADEKFVELYPLKNVIDILNILGHPSATIRDELLNELIHFKISDPLWKHFANPFKGHVADSVVSNTNKFGRMCICDLKIALESLRYKRLKIINGLSHSKDMSNPAQELKLMEDQARLYEKRIDEIELIKLSFLRKINSKDGAKQHF